MGAKCSRFYRHTTVSQISTAAIDDDLANTAQYVVYDRKVNARICYIDALYVYIYINI